MKEITISKYIDLEKRRTIYGENGDFVSTFLFTTILVNELGIGSYNEIKKFCKNAQINLTDEEIKKYLNQKFIKNDLELKCRLAQLPVQKTHDRLAALKYSYDSYTLFYFKTYVTILKDKIEELFEMIDTMQEIAAAAVVLRTYEDRKKLKKLNEQLVEYDIHINENNEIYFEDLLRIIKPLIYNIQLLKEMVEKGNNLETYFIFKLSLDSIHRSGLEEKDYYPVKELQIKNLDLNEYEGYIPLSDEQKRKLKEEENNYQEHVLHILNNMQ